MDKGNVRLHVVDSPRLLATARVLMSEFAEVARGIGRWPSAAADIAALPAPYTVPGAMLLVAMDAASSDALDDATALGCGAIVPLAEPGVAELQRIYVRPAARRRGVAEAIIVALMEHSRSHGRNCIRLVTAPQLTAAQALYASLGFSPIERYRRGLRSEALCFERRAHS